MISFVIFSLLWLHHKTLCEKLYPDFYTSPRITYRLVSLSFSFFSQEYEFTCNFDKPDTDELVFKTEWFVDDRSVYESPFTNYTDVDKLRTLTDTRLNAAGITTVGFQLHCDVRAGYISKPFPSLPSSSSRKFIGIEVLPPIVNVQEGRTTSLSIRPSIEIGCGREGGGGGCSLAVSAEIPDEDEDQCQLPSRSSSGCGVHINTESWRNYYKLDISSADTSNSFESGFGKQVILTTDTLYFSHRLWQNYILPPITVYITKDTNGTEGRLCQLFDLTYLRDYKNRILKFRLAGVFTLFKAQNAEVQVQSIKCGNASCICGVVIRVGRTAFMINHCNLGFWFIDYILCDDGNVLDVRLRFGTQFEMFLPSGTKITIKRNKNGDKKWLSIFITPSLQDIGTTTGLCNELTSEGVIEFNQELYLSILLGQPHSANNDEVFFNQWRSSQDNNLFIPGNWDSLPRWNATGTLQHCRCHETLSNTFSTILDCSPSTSTATCSTAEFFSLYNKKRCISPLRQ